MGQIFQGEMDQKCKIVYCKILKYVKHIKLNKTKIFYEDFTFLEIIYKTTQKQQLQSKSDC